MIDAIDDLFQEIDRGREGKNQGFSMGLSKLEGLVDGVCPKTYTLIYSGTGNGKSSLTLFSYVYSPMIEHFNDGKFKVTYFSLEMAEKTIWARLLCLHIFDTYGIELSSKEIFSRKKNYRLCDEYYDLLKESKPWLQQAKKIVKIYDKTCTATYLYNKLVNELKNTGKLDIKGKGDEAEILYAPNDPELIHNVVIDHIGLVKASASQLKNEIDAVSRVLVMLRNACGISPVVIMQTNRDSANIERRKQGLNNLTLNDIKDSGNPAQDCEVAISIFNPHREKLATYSKYDIKILQDNFRVITIQKARDGASSIELGVNFFGKMGYWHDMPKPEEVNDWSLFTSPAYIIGDSIDKEEEIKEVVLDNSKQPFKFVM
jgi:hypothetical protein